MRIIGCRKIGKGLPRGQFLCKVEDCLEKGSKTLVFDYLRIFKKGEHEILREERNASRLGRSMDLLSIVPA